MHISFDLDSTIITGSDEFETESQHIIARLLGIEKVRKGTPSLVKALQKKGHNIHIYTTSYRKKWKIRFTLRYYRIKVKSIVNQFENEKKLKKLNVRASKYPPAFNFDIHIDDLKGVGVEGEKFNFNTIIVDTHDTNWENSILMALKQFNTE